MTEGEQESVFFDRLRAAGWSVTTSTAAAAQADVQHVRPVLVVLDNKIPELPVMAKWVLH